MAFTRTDARERLTNIDRAAEILISAVAYAPSRELLERTDLGAIPQADELVPALRGVQARALRALQSPSLVTADGTAPRGRGRVGSDGAATHPKVMVAGMIALAWEDVRGRRPGPRNTSACEAADLLWRFTTVIMERGRLDKRLGLKEAAARGDDRLTQWRRHFEAALAETPILGSNHKEYMRHLREARAQEARRATATSDLPPLTKARTVASCATVRPNSRARSLRIGGGSARAKAKETQSLPRHRRRSISAKRTPERRRR